MDERRFELALVARNRQRTAHHSTLNVRGAPGARELSSQVIGTLGFDNTFLCHIILLCLIIVWRVVWWNMRAYTMQVIGIVGFGNIGRMVARNLAGFRCMARWGLGRSFPRHSRAPLLVLYICVETWRARLQIVQK
jgi:hypothetical protein